jgi:AraC family transcriptional regulator of adaptative response/methylated-DNA-[protein]-cysteine methyltransferase
MNKANDGSLEPSPGTLEQGTPDQGRLDQGKPDPRLQRARELLDGGELTLEELARAVGISASHLQRKFKAWFGLSPATYLAQRKLGMLKSALREGNDVSAALYDAGYGSPSRVYESGAAKLGMTPARYRAGGAGETIRWSLVDSALGTALVATTQRGICMVELGEDAITLEVKLRDEFPHAQLQRVDAGRDEFLAPRLQAVAAQLGQPNAARAVASACAHNRIALVVPCHRVIRGDGSLGGYRWGLPLKQQLLQREQVA